MKNLQNLSDEQITADLLPQKFGRRGMIWTAGLIVICCIGAFAYIKQLREGLVVTNMGDYASWGIYISNFVFFVAVSLVGSLITAIFRLSGVPWRTPLTRIAEIIAVSIFYSHMDAYSPPLCGTLSLSLPTFFSADFYYI
jgi:hypothetical protein